MKAKVGDRVVYQFDEAMAQRVNLEIDSRAALMKAAAGNRVMCGQFCAAIVTRVHGSGVDDVNLKLILDAPFDLWIENILRWDGKAGQGINKWRLAA